MSQENLEVARRVYEAWNEGDFPAFFAAMDPEIELVLPEGGINAGTRQGLRGMGQFLESYVESFEDFQVESEEFFEAGDQVVAFVRISGRGRGSGIETENRPAQLLTLRGGKIRRLEVFPERERQAALEAAGLRE